MNLKWAVIGCSLAILAGPAHALNTYSLPARVTVQPVIIVPNDMGLPDGPSTADTDQLDYHINWARNAYWSMLDGRDTFGIAGPTVVIHDPDHNAATYANDDGQLTALVAMHAFGYNRYNNPYIYVALLWGVSWGQGTFGSIINGGLDGGGGIVVIKFYGSSSGYNSTGNNWQTLPGSAPPNYADKMQSTIQHEIGHAFGLSHSFGVYPNNIARYNYCYGTSVMSYNPLQWTHQDTPASQLVLNRTSSAPSKPPNQTPLTCNSTNQVGIDGALLPEDKHDLAMNKRVFPNYYFDPEVDIPAALTFATRGGWAGELGINQSTDPSLYLYPGDQDPSAAFTLFSSDSGASGSVQNVLGPRTLRAATAFDSTTMWNSGTLPAGGYASIFVQSTTLTLLNGLVVHSGANGNLNSVGQVCLVDWNTGVQVGCASNVGVDDPVSFPQHVSSTWLIKLYPKAGSSSVTVRGLQFLSPEGEIFLHQKPEELLTMPVFTTQPADPNACSNNEYAGSKVSHVITPVIPPNNYAPNGSGYDASTMWHSCNTNSLGWTSLQVTFPFPISLNKIDIHSQHSGLYHAANQIQVEFLNSSNQFVFLNRKTVAVDDNIPFNQTKAATWKISFHSNDGYVTIRGLRFHTASSRAHDSGYTDLPDCVLYP